MRQAGWFVYDDKPVVINCEEGQSEDDARKEETGKRGLLPNIVISGELPSDWATVWKNRQNPKGGTPFTCPHCQKETTKHYHAPEGKDVACPTCAGRTDAQFMADFEKTEARFKEQGKQGASWPKDTPWPFGDSEKTATKQQAAQIEEEKKAIHEQGLKDARHSTHDVTKTDRTRTDRKFEAKRDQPPPTRAAADAHSRSLVESLSHRAKAIGQGIYEGGKQTLKTLDERSGRAMDVAEKAVDMADRTLKVFESGASTAKTTAGALKTGADALKRVGDAGSIIAKGLVGASAATGLGLGVTAGALHHVDNQNLKDSEIADLKAKIAKLEQRETCKKYDEQAAADAKTTIAKTTPDPTASRTTEIATPPLQGDTGTRSSGDIHPVEAAPLTPPALAPSETDSSTTKAAISGGVNWDAKAREFIEGLAGAINAAGKEGVPLTAEEDVPSESEIP